MNIPEEGKQHILDQIDIIKKYSTAVDESQGLVANAMTMLILNQSLQALSQQLNIIIAALSKDSADKPLLYTP